MRQASGVGGAVGRLKQIVVEAEANSNFPPIFNSQAVLVVLTSSLVVTLTPSEYDLPAASVLSLSAMLIAVLNTRQDVPIGWAIVIALPAEVLVDAINGILAVLIGVGSIIATLGMGSLVSGITLRISHGNLVSGISNTLVELVMVPRFLVFPLALSIWW